MRYVGIWHLADELRRGRNAQSDGLTGSIAVFKEVFKVPDGEIEPERPRKNKPRCG